MAGAEGVVAGVISSILGGERGLEGFGEGRGGPGKGHHERNTQTLRESAPTLHHHHGFNFFLFLWVN